MRRPTPINRTAVEQRSGATRDPPRGARPRRRGGRLTVVGDLSFTLRSGDKMGVVGRNGAGKTSTLRVLAGEQPRGGFGRPPRRGRLPAPGPAAAPGARGHAGARARAGGARARRPRGAAREGTDRAGGGSVRSQGRPVRRARGGVPRPGGYQAESEATHDRRRARPAAGSARRCRSRRCPAASDGGSSSRASCSAGSTCCCSTSRRTTSTSTRSTG